MESPSEEGVQGGNSGSGPEVDDNHAEDAEGAGAVRADIYDGLAERKRKRMRTNLRRLKRLESRHGIESVFEAIQEVLERKK